jgi:DNA end-binding protein Ku
MRAMWTGAISFGLVAAPVKMYLGHDGRGDGLRLACKDHQQPIVAKRRCAVDDRVLRPDEIVRVAEIGGQFVMIEEHELDALPLNTLHLIEIEAFIPRAEVPLDLYAKGLYYLAPDKGGERSYALLRAALLKSNTVAIARVGMREREQLVAVGVHEDALILTQLAWPADVRGIAGLNLPEANFGERELNLALLLVGNMRGAWSPLDYIDHHRQAMADLIALKAQGAVPPAAKRPQRDAGDLLDALKASVAGAKRQKATATKPKPKRKGKAA